MLDVELNFLPLGQGEKRWAIGERVRNSKAGAPWVGVIRALMPWVDYQRYFLKGLEVSGGWDRMFPGWRDGLVAVVDLDRPSKGSTLEEALEFGLSREQWEQMPLRTMVFSTVCNLVRI